MALHLERAPGQTIVCDGDIRITVASLKRREVVLSLSGGRPLSVRNLTHTAPYLHLAPYQACVFACACGDHLELLWPTDWLLIEVACAHGAVRFGLQAPPAIAIWREELWRRRPSMEDEHHDRY